MGYTLGQLLFGGEAGTDDLIKRGILGLLGEGGVHQAVLPPWANKLYSEATLL